MSTTSALRHKVFRACDRCRQKRTKCLPAPDREPLQCVTCLEKSISCSWNLPISETRARRQRISSPRRNRSPDSVSRAAPQTPRSNSQPANENLNPSVSHHSPQVIGQSHEPSRMPAPVYGQHRGEMRVRGPTSVSHLMHSTYTFPVEKLADHNDRYRTFPVIKPGGRDAIIKMAQSSNSTRSASKGIISTSQSTIPPNLPPELIERLLRVYFDTHSPLFPVASKDVFISSTPVSPNLLYTMCGVGAMTHTTNSSAALSDLQSILASMQRNEDLMKDCSLQGIQALLIYSLSLEMEGGNGGTTNWKALGLAVRQAQDLGLHREIGNEDPAYAEVRRQIWGGLVVADRWISTIYGLPMMIDLTDCDCLFPVDTAFKALIDLSIIQGQVLKLLYTPTGIVKVTNIQAETTCLKIENWLNDLPTNLQTKGRKVQEIGPQAGMLGLLFVATKFLFCRPFMRINYTTDHLTFAISLEDFKDINERAKDAIEWASANAIYLEGWQFGLYALFICALIQYHSYTRTRLPTTLVYLATCTDIMSQISVPACAARTKLADIIQLLHMTASHYPETSSGVNQTLNPIPGVRLRAKDPDLTWQPEQGAFVGNSEVDPSESRIPHNLVGYSPLSETPSPRMSSTARPVTSEDNINPMMDRLGPEIDFGYEIHFPDQWVNFELDAWNALLNVDPLAGGGNFVDNS